MYSCLLNKSLKEIETITVSARDSKLSQIQVQEVLNELQLYHKVKFHPFWTQSIGDKDLKTSLRTLGSTDFFTKEIDEAVLNKQCRISIHSAKDLPIPLTKGLVMVALTKGIDQSDSLVFRNGDSLQSLGYGAIIATSSVRREMSVLQVRSDLKFCDVRGSVLARLEKLDNKEFDGLVVAEAAIIRLNEIHRPRIKLPGETAEFQGQLAILAREDDYDMINLFACIDSKRNG